MCLQKGAVALRTFLSKDVAITLLAGELEGLFELRKHLKAVLPPLRTKQAAAFFVQLNQAQVGGLGGRCVRA